MHRNRSVNVHQFSMIPRAEVPRSSFRMQKTYKSTFDAGFLVPIFCEEVLPGDNWNLRCTAFARMATPLVPIMDNAYVETFFFFVPNRLVWDNWVKFMGEQEDPGDSIDYEIPFQGCPNGGHSNASVQAYMGLPAIGQVEASSYYTHSVLPIRGYKLIWNEWFRDQNLRGSIEIDKGDGPEPAESFELLHRGKRHDYFTSCLPWPQKGESVGLPLGGVAPVVLGDGTWAPTTGNSVRIGVFGTGPDDPNNARQIVSEPDGIGTTWGALATTGGDPGDLFADLSEATAATINQLRQAFQIQKLLERDARGGTRYTEIVRAHFGVLSPDARLQRPEYLGGGSTPLSVNPVAQTSATSAEGTDTPQGNLSAIGTALARNHGFTASFTEHGYVIGLINVRADLTYQQGLRRHWSRRTRYDYYFPAFAMLGEQAVLSKEIYCTGQPEDENVFGYQERWAEYRYLPSEITRAFSSYYETPLDMWHLAQYFIERPTLNAEFINEDPPFGRIAAVGDGANGQMFLLDAFFDIKAARPLPLYSVPGFIDHF